MIRQHPNPQMSIPISLAVWHQLLAGTSGSGYEKEDWEIAAEAIDEWTRRHNPQALPMPGANGYQWKSQFLPNGTLLRTVFGGKNYHCQVEGDRILYNGQAVSPSGFVNAVGGIRRNAWRCTWILFPDSKDWQLADTLRACVRPVRARKPAIDSAQPAAHRAAVNAAQAAAPSPVPIACAADATLARPGIMCGTCRRNHGEDRITALLRQELLPMLYRMCSCESMAP